MKMDRRRLEHAHVRFAMLNVAQWYKESFEGVDIIFWLDQSDSTLLEFTPLYQAAFYKKYSGMLAECLWEIFHLMIL